MIIHWLVPYPYYYLYLYGTASKLGPICSPETWSFNCFLFHLLVTTPEIDLVLWVNVVLSYFAKSAGPVFSGLCFYNSNSIHCPLFITMWELHKGRGGCFSFIWLLGGGNQKMPMWASGESADVINSRQMRNCTGLSYHWGFRESIVTLDFQPCSWALAFIELHVFIWAFMHLILNSIFHRGDLRMGPS